MTNITMMEMTISPKTIAPMMIFMLQVVFSYVLGISNLFVISW